MRIKVDIAGLIEVFEFDKETIVVGGDDGCDIFLAYEGVAEKHLFITRTSDYYQVTQLSSIYKTYINDDELKPGLNAVLKSSSVIEIGGIFISLDEDLDKEKNKFQFEIDSKLEFDVSDSRQSIESLLSEKSVAPNLEALEEIGSTIEAEDSLFEEKRPEQKEHHLGADWYEEASANKSAVSEQKIESKEKANLTGSRRIKVSNAKSSVRQKRVSTKKQIKSSKEKTQTAIYTLGVILIVGISAFFYRENIEDRMANFKKEKQVEIRLSDLLEEGFEQKKKYLDSFINNKSCEAEVRLVNICKTFKPIGLESKGYKIVVSGDTLVIGVNSSGVDARISSFIPKRVMSDEKLKYIIKQEYNEYFDFSEFQANGNIPPLKNYSYTKEENKELIYLLSLLFEQDNVDFKKFKNVFLFSYLDFKGEIVPQDFLDFTPYTFQREMTFANIVKFRLELAWNYDLTENFSRLIATFASSKEFSFDPDLALEEQQKHKENLIKRAFIEKGCEPIENFDFCDLVAKRRELGDGEGHLVLDGHHLFFLNLDSIATSFAALESRSYTTKDKQFVLRFLKDVSVERKKEFLSNGYINHVVGFDYLGESLIADFILNENMVNLFPSTQKVLVVGFKQVDGELKFLRRIDISNKAYQELLTKKASERVPYLIKSKVSTFKEFLKTGLIEVSAYE